MNKEMMQSKLVYPKIVLYWGNEDSGTEITVRDKTLGQAYNMAIEFGYKPPVWYKPWQYITGGIGVITVGFGEEK